MSLSRCLLPRKHGHAVRPEGIESRGELIKILIFQKINNWPCFNVFLCFQFSIKIQTKAGLITSSNFIICSMKNCFVSAIGAMMPRWSFLCVVREIARAGAQPPPRAPRPALPHRPVFVLKLIWKWWLGSCKLSAG